MGKGEGNSSQNSPVQFQSSGKLDDGGCTNNIVSHVKALDGGGLRKGMGDDDTRDESEP
jgi:hypothetical protein